MASWEGAMAGASTGAATGNPWVMGGLALLGGLFGGRQKLTPEQRLQRNISRQLYGFSQSAPFSDTGERLALGQDLGLLGEFGANQRQNLFAQMPALGGMSNAPDMLQNLNSLQTAQRMNLSSQHMMNALASRRQALLQAAGVAGSVGPAQPTSQLPQMLGQLAQAYAYSQANRPQQQVGAGGGGRQDGRSGNYAGGLGGVGITGEQGGAATGTTARNIGLTPGQESALRGLLFRGGEGMGGLNREALAQSTGAMIAPGNEPLGLNGFRNQYRQASGQGRTMEYGDIDENLRAGLYNPLGRRYQPGGSGLIFGY